MVQPALKRALVACMLIVFALSISSTAGAKSVTPKKNTLYVGCPSSNLLSCENRMLISKRSSAKLSYLQFTQGDHTTCKNVGNPWFNYKQTKLSRIKRGKFSGTLLLENIVSYEAIGDEYVTFNVTWTIKGVFKSRKRAVVTFTPSPSRTDVCTTEELKPFSTTYKLLAS